ncbi:MAG: hypothetical protein GC201_12475 [Alphaproteobacteria bacterium]|nr:hypothetical protein [Alphaproteobacteria bacterium]
MIRTNTVNFGMAGPLIGRLAPRFQRIATDAWMSTVPLGWADRLFFLSAAGDRHDAWRTGWADRFLDDEVPEWGAIVSAVIEAWQVPEITRFEVAASFSLCDYADWRRAAESWCHSQGVSAQLMAFQADRVGYAGLLVRHELERRETVLN